MFQFFFLQRINNALLPCDVHLVLLLSLFIVQVSACYGAFRPILLKLVRSLPVCFQRGSDGRGIWKFFRINRIQS